MGISSLPNPSENVLTLFLFNVALAVSILKEFLRSALHFLRLSSPPPAEMDGGGGAAEPGLAERFRKRCRPFRFGSALEWRRAADCRVCLGRFEPESVVNRLACGHVFHMACLETWFEYHHATCPLCRAHVLHGEEPTASFSPSVS
ncbi:probable E3 ubiquitin-protein ligase XERICO [Zingiber officinale]|uniref:probable E3 ubiquitin-protein ligase XERICO n=1 Tax=Zingiber officinale TaxID=94328 RepID=UPI001C4C2B03|nr:probable E3 ubiquitin-protein ligase XERICO [Zingiber officinale]